MKQLEKYIVAGLVSSIIFGASSVYAEQKSLYESKDGVRVGARVTYRYLPDSLFKVKAKIGYVTDIELKPGEVITYIAGGDTTRWLIDKAMVSNVQHVYLKPIEKDIKTNVIINTNYHSYRIEVVSGEEYDPLVTFQFTEMNPVLVRNRSGVVPGKSGEVSGPARRNYNYRIKAKKSVDSSLMPQEIFDDGQKTYIKMKSENKYDLPVIYTIDPWDMKSLSMVNYRVQDDYFVVDRVIEHGRLFFHQKFYIDFYNEGISQKKIKEYRQMETMAGRMKKAWVDERDKTREDFDSLVGRRSNQYEDIRIYSGEPDEGVLESSVRDRQEELQRLRQMDVDGSGMEDRDLKMNLVRQDEMRRKEEKRFAREAKEREAVEREWARQEYLRQEAVRREEEKRLAREAKERQAAEKERARQEELMRLALEKQKAEEARQQKKLEEAARKRNAEIQRISEAEQKMLNDLRALQAEKQRKVNEGNAAANQLRNLNGNG